MVRIFSQSSPPCAARCRGGVVALAPSHRVNMVSSISKTVVLFDAQNFYRGARRAFFDDRGDSSRLGQFWPRAVAEMIVGRDEGRELSGVRIYTGRPARTKQPRGHAANVRQSEAWSRSGVGVYPRLLRYPRSWPASPPYEKGVDVELAVDTVSLSLRRECEVIVVASADTDLLPAVAEVRRRTDVLVEVAGWWGAQSRQRLSVPHRNVWCHWLRRDDYERVRDDTNYGVGAA